MNVLTKQNLANIAAERWCRQYKGRRAEIHEKLLALGSEPSIEDVNNIIGNTSWTDLHCDVCRESVERVGNFDVFGEYVFNICEKCLRQTLQDMNNESV